MRIRVDIHVEADDRPVELWVTGYSADGKVQECYSTHEARLISHVADLLQKLPRAIAKREDQSSFEF